MTRIEVCSKGLHLGGNSARTRLWAAVVTALASGGCSLLVDTSGLTTSGDAAVGPPRPGFGPPMAVATGQTGVFAIESDDTSVYWLTRQNDDFGTVASITRAGAGPVVIASMQAYPRAFASDSTRLYWATGSAIGGSTAIASIAKTGGATPDRVSVSGWGHADVSAIAVRGTQLIWATVTEGGGTLHRSSVSGVTTSEVLATGQGPISAIALAPPAVYWASTNAILTTAPTAPAGSPPLIVAPGSAASMIVVDGTLYWASADGTLFDRAGGAQPAVLAQGLSSPAGLAADDKYVYCACAGSGTVVAVPRAMGASVIVAHGVEPVAVAVTADAVYFADRGAATIVRVAKQ